MQRQPIRSEPARAARRETVKPGGAFRKFAEEDAEEMLDSGDGFDAPTQLAAIQAMNDASTRDDGMLPAYATEAPNSIAEEPTPTEEALDAIRDVNDDDIDLTLDEWSARYNSEMQGDDEIYLLECIERSSRLSGLLSPIAESLAIAEEVVEELEPQLRNREGWNSDECLGCRITQAIVGYCVRTALAIDCDSLSATIASASAVAEFYGIREEHVVRGVIDLWYQLDVTV